MDLEFGKKRESRAFVTCKTCFMSNQDSIKSVKIPMDTQPASFRVSESDVILSLDGITKEFSGVRVLDRVSLDIQRGEIMGLIGENGAGKSTLIKILSGIYQPTLGSLRLNGDRMEVPDYITAKRLGIGMVPQEFNLINSLTVYENIFLGNEITQKSKLLNKEKMRELACGQLQRLRMPIDVNRLVSDLGVAEKQMVEISKALLLHARILIMDEPTTTLTGHEVKTLFILMRNLQKQRVTIIFVSHKLNEVKMICDRVAILRDGNLISVDKVSSIDERDIARKMIGRDFQQVFPPKNRRHETDIVLEVEHLNIKGLLHDVSFSLRKGEILGFAGLVGSGRTELAEAVMGLRSIDSGTVRVAGRIAAIRNARDAVDHGIGYLSEDRQGKGIVQGFGIPQNITLASLCKYVKRSLIDKKAEEKKSGEYEKAFNIVASSSKMDLRYFSGGNQQKVYLARWVDTCPSILILDEPTRGIDVGAKREIYEFIHILADRGISCIVISSEMEEVIGICSRVYLMNKGMIAGCLEGDNICEEEIMFHAAGIKGKRN